MKIPIVKYREGQKIKHSWITLMLRRVRLNKNNLVAVIGKTGSGKTWSAIAICEMLSERNNTPFTIDNIVFGLKPLLKLINSGKLKKGSCIIFDEPQISISSRDWQSKANKVFNYLVSTFRYQNLNMFFCAPYEDLLDKSTRKLFHIKFETVSINQKDKTVKMKPKILEYNSHLHKEYEAFIKISFKPKDKSCFVVRKLKRWNVPKPSDAMIKVYEAKRKEWHNKLTRDMDKELEAYEKKERPVNEFKENIIAIVDKIGKEEAAIMCKKSRATIYNWYKEAKEKNLIESKEKPQN